MEWIIDIILMLLLSTILLKETIIKYISKKNILIPVQIDNINYYKEKKCNI